MTNLGRGTALGINNFGEIVGNGVYPFLHSSGRMFNLNQMVDVSAWRIDEAMAINDVGQIACGGVTRIPNGQLGGLLLSPVKWSGLSIGLYAGLTIIGNVGKTYLIQYTSEILQDGGWVSLTNVTLSQPTYFWADPSATVSFWPERYYRAIELP